MNYWNQLKQKYYEFRHIDFIIINNKKVKYLDKSYIRNHGWTAYLEQFSENLFIKQFQNAYEYRKQWFYNGRLHREDGPAQIEIFPTDLFFGSFETYYYHGYEVNSQGELDELLKIKTKSDLTILLCSPSKNIRSIAKRLYRDKYDIENNSSSS